MDFVEQLKSNVDIAQVVGEYVRLRKSGPSRLVGLCPFHTEKTPSFGVNVAHQFYKCFGCGAGGDVIKFVMEIEGFSFWEALKSLAERHGIPLPKRSDYADEDTRLRAVLHDMHEVAQKAFRAALESPAGSEARRYLQQRGVRPEVAEEFGLGFADKSGQFLVRRLREREYSEPQMESSGLVRKRAEGEGFYDNFRGRLMFPIHNESGKLVGFAGRSLSDEDEPKYLNSPSTSIYQKSSVVYNIHRARSGIRQADFSILVEGYMDVIGLHGAGVGQAVASCGTALTSQQVRLLRRHSGNIVVNFDPDDAGAAAAERSVQMLLEESAHVRVLELEEGLDPDEYVRKFGSDRYRARLAKAPRYFVWLADRARRRFDMRAAEGRVAGFQFLLPAIQRIPDKIERAAVANDVAAYLGVEPGLVLDQFRKAAAERKEKSIPAPRAEMPAREKILLRCLVESAEARAAVLPRLSPPLLEKMAARKILEAILVLGDRFQFAALDARLADADKDLLAGLLLVDELGEEQISVNQAIACLDRLEEEHRAAARAALKADVRAAEQAGDFQQAIRLTLELEQLGHG